MKPSFEIFKEAAQPVIVDHIEIQARPARFAPTPDAFRAGKVGAWLTATLHGSQLWHHQALALEKIANDANVVIATSTASGKTLGFQGAVMRAYLEKGQRSLVFYALKALASDQAERWRTCFIDAGLSPDLVGEINGDVSIQEREEILDRCAVILITEDVAHAWMMRLVTAPSVQRLLRSLACVVIDEAHALEGVFGSSSAYLFRRLQAAAAAARRSGDAPASKLQFVAATATIADPLGHLSRLTGCSFEAITEADNGAPFHGMDLLHIEGPEYGAPAEKMVADIVTNLAGTIAPNAAIAFIDGRQAAERITQRVGHDQVQPYRSGYNRDERRDIEKRMRKGLLRAVVSTSALELGIDVPGFTVGMTVGIPSSCKALRQRIGRAGRAQRSVFAVIAPSMAFAQTGTTFRDFALGPVEQSPLYLNNRFIQYQHACCLIDEVTAVRGKAVLPDTVNWPEGFASMFEAAQPGNPRPRDLDQVAIQGSDCPHTAFSLRQIGDTQYRLRSVRGSDEIGTIELEKALREAYPGATYRHNKAAFRVVGWRSSPYERTITLKRVGPATDTKPMLKTVVGVSHDAGAIIDHRFRASSVGSIAEMSMEVVDSVEGYSLGRTALPYGELGKTDRAMRRQQRRFSTTGILLRIHAPWFEGAGDAPRLARRAVGTALVEMLARDRCISPSELRFAHYNLVQHSAAGPVKIHDGIAIFDGVCGGLRLSAPLFDDIAAYLDRFSKAVDLAGSEAMLDRGLVDRLIEWESELDQQAVGQLSEIAIDNEERIIFAPGSEVAVNVGGALHHRRLIEPQMFLLEGNERLGYRYESSPGVAAWTPHDKVEGIGADWRHVIWNARTGAIREIEA